MATYSAWGSLALNLRTVMLHVDFPAATHHAWGCNELIRGLCGSVWVFVGAGGEAVAWVASLAVMIAILGWSCCIVTSRTSLLFCSNSMVAAVGDMG